MAHLMHIVLVIYIFVVTETLSSDYTDEGSSYYNYYRSRELRSQERRDSAAEDLDGDPGAAALSEALRRRSENSHGSEEARGGGSRLLERERDMARSGRPDELESIFEGRPLPEVEKLILPEYTESLPGTWGRGARELGVQKHYPICHLERKIVNLNTIEYEYRPAYYEEVKCTQKYHESSRNDICSSLGFSCFQWNKTIHLTRRRYSSECWETKTMIIAAGCECMWPTHKLGDIKLHS